MCLVAALVACDEFGTGDCTLELAYDLRPRGEQVLAVGQSFTASISLSTCGGRERVVDTFTWSAVDTLVVRVDAVKARVTGRAPGSTFVEVRGKQHPFTLGRIAVRVE